ncbi:folliculin-interacting protein N-terminus-domain-containing protein [Diplogelasinospora grovesii]|uniref:Folliculin-interacting protein N-terminus-domain-containing protein n=1 Tax=Diplogelasinospora grovesii TaxID=303347 RepID=A0AAN6NIZ9_9PEZI|nr:folliculin-interacting protein N-terminus-domain-containing protein [Diplogelasinospora grovesii]
MLGKLFNLGAGSGAGTSSSAQTTSHKPISSLESVHEDVHTRNLLFPDPQDLFEHRLNQVFPLSSPSSLPTSATANAFDYNGDIELEARDVRIVIMQDALGPVTASLLYDSQAAPGAATPSFMDRPSATAGAPLPYFSIQEARRAPTSPRKPSISQNSQRPIIIQPDSPKMRQGAFDRRPSVHGRNQGQGYIESDSQRAWREYREELTTFSSCIFGNSELMAYKGTSTKVHVVPSEPRAMSEHSSVFGDGRGSLGRSSLRASRLSQSSSSENVPPFTTPPTPGGAAGRGQDRKKVLVTRLFPVTLPTEDDAVETPQRGRYSEENTGFPFPTSAAEYAKSKKKKPQPKQKRTPMYAIALVINLPSASSQGTPATATSRSAFRAPSSYTEQDSFPSSFSSARPSGWTLIGHQGGNYGLDSFETSIGGDIEDQIDAITQHWDIIMRTLTHLQSVVAATLFTMLKQADLASPDPLPVSGRRSEDGLPMKPPKTNAKHIILLPNCLLENRKIGAEVETAKTRIVAGIRAARVVTGQNRWPIWREEARWVAKWAGTREQGFFFFNLLTGFLATHTDWLQALAPASYRRRHWLQQKAKGEEDASIPSRTIIVAHDKMAARRLVFLLAAFLPGSQQLPSLPRAHRPSTSTSLGAGAFSQSPPSYVVPILKEESLRRKINRRTAPHRASHSRHASIQSQRGAIPPPLAHLSMEGRHERRASDAASIRTTHLPLPGSDAATRKSSAATTATITQETSVAHFTSIYRAEVFSPGRPGSSNSTAANDLKRITREDTAGAQNGTNGGSRQVSSRWSVISGLWNGRRRDSTSNATTATYTRNSSGAQQPNSNAGSSPNSPTKTAHAAQVEQATDTATSESSPTSENSGGQGPTGTVRGPPASNAGVDRGESPLGTSRYSTSSSTDQQRSTEPKQTDTVAHKTAAAKRTPDPSGAFASPVKTSINVDDGVIDVDVPFPDYITSFETAVSSPSSSGYLSTPGFGGTGFEAFEQSCRVSVDGDVPLNVAGWLQHYHPDFVLQALPSQNGLMEQIKASLRAEPSPAIPPPSGAHSPCGQPEKRWMDISTAVIADTTNFTITRIRYRRLVKPKPVVVNGNGNSSVLLTPSISPYETHLEEEFIEEQIVTLDEVLIEAVERVIAMTSDISKESSQASSRSTSKQRTERRNSTAAATTQMDDPARAHSQHMLSQALSVPQEVPRTQCKTVILSALEEVVRDVVEQREIEQHQHNNSRGAIREKESPLREAVRGWLESIESGE